MAFKQIPIAETITGGPHDRFPVYLKPSAIAGWRALTQAEADSIRVYADSGKVTELPREVVDSDQIHYRHDGLDTGQSVYVDYDGIRADYAATDTNGRNAVWENGFDAVWHMENSSPTDSTGNGNDGTAVNTPAVDNSGQVGDAVIFTANASEYITTPYAAQLTDFTMEVWFKATTIVNNYQRIVDKDFANGTFVGRSNKADNWGGGVREASSPFGRFVPLGDGIWHHIASRRAGTTHTILGDGGSVSTSGTVTGAALNAETLDIAARNDGTTQDYFDGVLDEIRVSSVARLDSWIATGYDNQSNPSTFFGTATDMAEAISVSVMDAVSRQDSAQSVVTIACGVAEGLIQDDSLGSAADIAASIADTGILTDSESALIHAAAALVEGVKAGEHWAVQADAQAAIDAHTALSSQFVISATQAGHVNATGTRAVQDSVALLLNTIMQIGSERAITDRASIETILSTYRSDNRVISGFVDNALRISVSVADSINRSDSIRFPNLSEQYSYVTIGALSVIAAVSADAGIIPRVTADIDIKPEN